MNNYFYLDHQNRQQGPVSPSSFSALGVTADTLVWCSGMNDWTRAGAVAELAPYFQSESQQTVPPRPAQPSQQPEVEPQPTIDGGPTYTSPGSTNDGAGYGASKQKPNATGYLPPKPDNYLVWGILTTLFCCMPFGIVSIVYSSRVDTLYTCGKYTEAAQASANARKWALIAAISVAVIPIAYVLFIIFVLAASSGMGALF